MFYYKRMRKIIINLNILQFQCEFKYIKKKILILKMELMKVC